MIKNRGGRVIDSHATMHTLFEAHAKENPHHIAIVFEDQTLTYGELNQKANQLAHHLKLYHFKPDTLIGISLPRSPDLLIAILGILKAGLAYVPLDENHPPARIKYILEETKLPLLITHSTFSDIFYLYPERLFFLDHKKSELIKESQDNPPPISKAHHLAYVIFTSGSTGHPKGVLIEHGSLVNYIHWFSHYSESSPQKRIDFSANFVFDIAITTSIGALALGLQVVIVTEKVKHHIRKYLQHLSRHKINIVKLTPSYFRLMLDEVKNNTLDLSHLQTLVLGGENLLTKDCREWLKYYPHHVLFNEYGPTETTVAVTHYKITSANINQLDKVVPIGKAGFNVTCKLLDYDKDAEKGELYISGLSLARGYLNQASLTSHFFREEAGERWYKTGDICRLLSDGNIEFIHRVDDQVKIRGYRIELGEIETCLAQHPDIKAAAVLVQEQSANEKRLVAYYVPRYANKILNENELQTFLQQRLTFYMIPSYFIALKHLPLNANGKLDKKAILTHKTTKSLMLPMNVIEDKTTDIWREIFNAKEINLHSDFFELGGHSLTAVRMITKIEKEFGVFLRLEDVYKAYTISDLTKIIASSEVKSENTLTVAPSTYDDIIPLSDFQLTIWIANIYEPRAQQLNIIGRRRVAVKFDIAALNFAFELLFKKHEVLCYHASKRWPMQRFRNAKQFNIVEEDLSKLPESERELALERSLQSLRNGGKWPKEGPLLLVKIMQLSEQVSELQICAAHLDFDDASIDILLKDLSYFYGLYNKNISQPILITHAQYKDYVFYERMLLNQTLEKQLKFWETYFEDTTLVTLPSQDVVKNMGKRSYSTYLELPDHLSKNINTLRANFHVSYLDLLTAALSLGLKKLAGHLNKEKIAINIIKSTRDQEAFDDMIGCFLGVDLIKVDMAASSHLIEVAKNVQRSKLETAKEQNCSGMAKLACLHKKYKPGFFMRHFLNTILYCYCGVLKKYQLNPKILQLYAKLSSLRTAQQFIIDINLLTNFVAPQGKDCLFGGKTLPTRLYPYDVSRIDNVLDISFMKDEVSRKSFLIISGNLTQSFREALGDEMIKVLQESIT